MRPLQINFACFFLFLFILNSACDDKKANDKKVNTGPANQEEETKGFDDFSAKFKKLVKTDTALFRGVSLGTHVDSVRRFESTSSPLESGDNYISYSIPFNIKEEADVLYYFGEDSKINKIETDIYPENIESQSSIFNEFDVFFTKKYGSPIIVGEVEKAWKSHDNKYLIEMKKTGNVKVHDIKIVYSISGGKGAV
ncbi:MAG TPA: hypothetical protein VF691_15360 [Cytophagaceae bacterium]|jgi:hypothetical protein